VSQRRTAPCSALHAATTLRCAGPWVLPEEARNQLTAEKKTLNHIPTLKFAPRRKAHKPKKHAAVDASTRAARRRGLVSIGTFDTTRLNAKASKLAGHQSHEPAAAEVADRHVLPAEYCLPSKRKPPMDVRKITTGLGTLRLNLKLLAPSGHRVVAQPSGSGLPSNSGGDAVERSTHSARLERASGIQLPKIPPRGGDAHQARMKAAMQRGLRTSTFHPLITLNTHSRAVMSDDSDRTKRCGVTTSLPELPLRKVDRDATIRPDGTHTIR
jgi:hypothetical protein